MLSASSGLLGIHVAYVYRTSSVINTFNEPAIEFYFFLMPDSFMHVGYMKIVNMNARLPIRCTSNSLCPCQASPKLSLSMTASGRRQRARGRRKRGRDCGRAMMQAAAIFSPIPGLGDAKLPHHSSHRLLHSLIFFRRLDSLPLL